ncbi:hypothetical protein CDAR_400931 [Caerostris darwini]|uniref:Uncharacterized protein n=1 Tax=Caerostris darwini TaxID=1538125 RepID=A0AAV4TJ70_9ARAC|nr:hypothetical protein CDAR_400931 [Caerostris darwini]
MKRFRPLVLRMNDKKEIGYTDLSPKSHQEDFLLFLTGCRNLLYKNPSFKKDSCWWKFTSDDEARWAELHATLQRFLIGMDPSIQILVNPLPLGKGGGFTVI